MPISFDPAKSEWNRQERGMPFAMAERFAFATALVREDDHREVYPEPRFQALGKIDREVVFLLRMDFASSLCARRQNRSAAYGSQGTRDDR